MASVLRFFFFFFGTYFTHVIQNMHFMQSLRYPLHLCETEWTGETEEGSFNDKLWEWDNKWGIRYGYIYTD